MLLSMKPAALLTPSGRGERRQPLPGKPRIEFRKGEREELRQQAWAALCAGDNPLRPFRYNGGQVRVVDEGDGSVRVKEFTRDRLRHDLANDLSGPVLPSRPRAVRSGEQLAT